MGDGQHVWAAAEWVLMIRNCFVREEGKRLILCSGIPYMWLEKNQTITFGPAPTSFGEVQVSIKPDRENVAIEWDGKWLTHEPPIEICVPGFQKIHAQPQSHSVTLKRGRTL